MTKHKHADLIHAWADGAEIQRQLPDSSWEDCDPRWYEGCEYRIKPEEKKPVVRWLWALKPDSAYIATRTFFTEEEAGQFLGRGKTKLEWSRTEFPE